MIFFVFFTRTGEFTVIHNASSAYTFTKAYSSALVWGTFLDGNTTGKWPTISGGGTLTQISTANTYNSSSRIYGVNRIYLAKDVVAGTVISSNYWGNFILTVVVFE